MILDEAHNAAPATASKYAVDSKTTKAVRDLCGRFENRLFLSATPHNGHSNSFSALLEMLDPQRFLRGTAISGPEQLTPIMVRRLKSDLIALGTSGFPIRRLVEIDLMHAGGEWQARALREDKAPVASALGGGRAVELELSTLLAEYTDLACPKKGSARLVFINLQKRLLSSVEAFTRTLEKHVEALHEATGPVGSGHLPGVPDETEDGLSSEAQDAQLELAIGAASARLERPKARASDVLGQMLALARSHRNAADAKARAFVAWIRDQLCPAVGIAGTHSTASKRWADRRVIIFTEYSHTKSYLRKLLAAACEGTELAEERIGVFDGGMSEDNRALIQEAFNGNPAEHPIRILIATDAAREGVNLQGHCADLFHYDIPWNPGRLEQRNGRIDRTLQPQPEVRCHYFFYPQRKEDDVLRVVVKKVGQIQRELGSVGAVVFDGITDLLERGGLNAGVLPTLEAEEKKVRESSTAAKELEAGRSNELSQEIRQAEVILNRSRKILEFDAGLLRDALDVGLHWAGAEALAPAPSPKDEAGLAAYQLPQLGHSWASTLDSARPARRRDESLHEWRSRAPLPVVFDAPEKLSTPVVQLHLKHPIVQRVLSRFLAQGYSAHDLSRVTVLRNPHDSVSRVIALGRLSVFGHGATRLHDQILAVAAEFGGPNAKLAPFGQEDDREAIKQLEALFSGSPTLNGVDARVQERLRTLAPTHLQELWPHVEHEADAQGHEVERKLRRRAESEALAMTRIIREQMALADRTLAEQLTLDFSEAERDQREQREADRKYVAARRKSLVAELEEEPKAILASYEILRRRVDLVGLVYLWPSSK